MSKLRSESRDAVSRVLTAISEWSIYLLVLLLPFFFLPNLVSSLYLGKQFLATLLILLSAIAVLLRILLRGEVVNFVKTKLSSFLLVFLVGVGLSTLLSGSRLMSFWGFGGSEPFTALSVILVTVFFFLAITLFTDKEYLGKTLFLFSLSSAILYCLTILISVLTAVLKLDFAVNLFGSVAWNPYGSANALALFAAAGFVFAFGVLFSGQRMASKFRAVLSVEAVSAAVVMLMVGYRYAYLLTAVALLMLMGFIFIKYKQEFIKKINIPLLAFIAVLMFFSFNISVAKFFNYPVEVSPTVGLSYSVAWDSMKDGIVNFVLGSGPSTFPYNFAMFKPESLNLTEFWNVRFTSGYAAMPTLMAELGLFGLVFFGFFVVYNLLSLAKRVLANEVEDGFYNGLVLAFVVLVGSMFFYPLNFVSFFYVIFVLALAQAIYGLINNQCEELSFDKISQKTLIIALSLIVSLIGTSFLFFVSATYFVGEMQYTRALVAMNAGQTDKALSKLLSAVKWYRDDSYYRALSSVLVEDTLTKLQAAEVAEEALQTYGQNFQTAIAFAQKATEINPAERENWLNLGGIYEKLMVYVSGADGAAVEAFQKVEKLEPHNPVPYLSVGRVKLATAVLLQQQLNAAKAQAQGQEINQEAVTQAEAKVTELQTAAMEALNKAIELKANLEAPYLLLARLNEMKGETEVALSNLRTARVINPQNIDSLFDFGRLLYNKNEYAAAAMAMENILKVYPESGNVKFLIGLSYDGLNKKDEAKKVFDELAAKNPEDEQVKKILENLRAGKPAVERGNQQQPTAPVAPVAPENQLTVEDLAPASGSEEVAPQE